MNKVRSDERLGAKLRVTENRCVLFNSLTYIYIYIYIYIHTYIYIIYYRHIHTYYANLHHGRHGKFLMLCSIVTQ